MRVERAVFFHRATTGHKRVRREPAVAPVIQPGRIPRVSRLMALALQFEKMLQNGETTDQSSLARTMQITQPRMTQIMNLLHLAPDIQETILFLPRTIKGDDPIHEKTLRSITAEVSWAKQRAMWQEMIQMASSNHDV